jgi:hypothetical protein
MCIPRNHTKAFRPRAVHHAGFAAAQDDKCTQSNQAAMTPSNTADKLMGRIEE